MTELFAYKIFTSDQFAQFRANGVFHGAPIDLADGYIHLSTQAQASETAAKHFARQDSLVLAMIDLVPLGDSVKWEVSRGGALFPHVYGPIAASAMVKHVVLRLDVDGRHQFPAGF